MTHRVEHLAEGVTLYLGDCRDILPTLGKVDAVVTDPPYGIGYVHRDLGGIIGDDRPFDPRPFLVGQSHIFWGANHFASNLTDQTRWLLWLKHDPGLFGKRGHAPFDLAWTDLGGSGRALKHIWDASIREGEWWGKPNCHPHQKPAELMEWCINLLPPAAITILDPFMGAGATGVAAKKLGRYFTGIEINQKYFDIACHRIEAAAVRPDMFSKTKPARQEIFEFCTCGGEASQPAHHHDISCPSALSSQSIDGATDRTSEKSAGGAT